MLLGLTHQDPIQSPKEGRSVFNTFSLLVLGSGVSVLSWFSAGIVLDASRTGSDSTARVGKEGDAGRAWAVTTVVES